MVTVVTLQSGVAVVRVVRRSVGGEVGDRHRRSSRSRAAGAAESLIRASRGPGSSERRISSLPSTATNRAAQTEFTSPVVADGEHRRGFHGERSTRLPAPQTAIAQRSRTRVSGVERIRPHAGSGRQPGSRRRSTLAGAGSTWIGLLGDLVVAPEPAQAGQGGRLRREPTLHVTAAGRCRHTRRVADPVAEPGRASNWACRRGEPVPMTAPGATHPGSSRRARQAHREVPHGDGPEGESLPPALSADP